MMGLSDMFYLKQFFLVMVRLGAFFAAISVFTSPSITNKTKLMFLILFAIIIFPFIGYKNWVIPTNIFMLSIAFIKEILVGYIIGFIVNIIFMSVVIMGEILGFQIGFTMASMVDPMSNVNNNILTIFSLLLATTIFIVINGHYYFIWAIKESFRFIPPGVSVVKIGSIGYMVLLIKKIFLIAIKIGAPGIATVLAVDVTLGLIGKVSPKIQIIFVGFPLKIALGLIALSFIFSISFGIWKNGVREIPNFVSNFFLVMR